MDNRASVVHGWLLARMPYSAQNEKPSVCRVRLQPIVDPFLYDSADSVSVAHAQANLFVVVNHPSQAR